jgi:hypothetical protein
MATESPRTGSARERMRATQQEWTGRAQEGLQHGYQSMTDCVAKNPASSVLTMFGVGFGLGVLIGYALSEPVRPRSRWYDMRSAERLGRSVLDSIVNALPDSISSRLPG